MLKCAACGKFIASNVAANCSVCPAIYHKECVSLSETTTVSKEWACPECKRKVRKGDNTPVRGAHDNGTGTAAPAPRRPAARAHTALSVSAPPIPAAPVILAPATVNAGPDTSDLPPRKDDVLELRQELAECVAEIRGFRREIAEFQVSVAGINARMDGIEQRLEAVEMKRTEPVAKITDLEHTIAQLKVELNDRDQEALLSDLEIGHLPEEKGENVLHAVTVLAAKLGVTLEERDVVYAERIGVEQHASAAGLEPRARRVVVRLTRRHLRDQLLQAARVRRTLNAADAGYAAPHQRIYLNERLTRINRQLFHCVREECRKLQWRYSWTKRGRIYARQGDGKPVHLIRSEADVGRVFGTSLV